MTPVWFRLLLLVALVVIMWFAIKKIAESPPDDAGSLLPGFSPEDGNDAQQHPR